ncbi:MAG: ATP-binding cassette domain-containing protein [Flavobacteriales bacterium]|jgi:putative ABC transport system ATP-binding protein|nr:ATP-binding cassette domain-containing protein [Flavobacteriales bacterium]
MLTTTNIAFKYKNGNAIQFPDINLDNASHALLLGKSGCGKTTLLHLLAGLLRPQEGTITINDTTLNNLSDANLDQFRGQEIGIIFQTPHFIDALSVKENLYLAQTLAGGKKDLDKIKALLSELDILDKLNAKTKELSQGQKQRVSIARALINSPQLILADEPTSALDDENCDTVINLLIEQANKSNATLLVVTHDNRLSNAFKTKIKL